MLTYKNDYLYHFLSVVSASQKDDLSWGYIRKGEGKV